MILLIFPLLGLDHMETPLQGELKVTLLTFPLLGQE